MSAAVERVYGPPGTGKTTALTAEIRDETARRGASELLVGSFSVTAAEVLAGRNDLPKSQVGTLHKHAFAAIGHAPVALDPKVIADWNDTERAEWHIHGDGRRGGPPVEQDTEDDEAPINTVGADIANAHTGDQLITALDLLRSTLTPPEDWPPNVTAFAERWTAWKAAVGAVDYSDMILNALANARDGQRAPGSPSVLIFDEAQDMTAAEVALVNVWGRWADKVVFGLDDDQAIMNFRGAHPETLIGLGADPTLTPDDDLYVDPGQLTDRVLDQSWRVPGAAHAVAENWVRKLSMRREKLYRPRAVDPDRFGADDDGIGTARVIGESLRDAALIDRVEAHVADGRTVAVLTSCNFHLFPVIKELRRRGIPFHNPLRPGEGRWNPLGPTQGVSTPQRLYRYLVMDERELGERSRLWTGEDVAAWLDLVDTKAAGLARGAKAAAKRFGGGTLDAEQVAGLFVGGEDSEAFAAAVEPSIDWLASVLLSSKVDTAPMRYALAVARNAGTASLVDRPMVSVGTFHSYKGGEADCSPPDEPVLTTNRGWVPIAELNPETDRLVSFNSDHHKIHRGGPRRPDGYRFTMASRPYVGDLLTLTTDTSRTRVTPNHHLTVRWSERARRAHIVYLMRRGNWWRIGVTQHDQSYGDRRAYGLRIRHNGQHADASWILAMFDTRVEALELEARLAWQYGVPDLMFEVEDDRGVLSTDQLHAIWRTLDSETGAKALLDAFGQSPEWPLFESKSRQIGMRNRFRVRAASLLPGWMELPTDPGRGQVPVWRAVTISRERYEGPVWSLDVERWHHYVSGGAIVHNCVMVAPDLSTAAAAQLNRPGGKDAVIRLLYVALTRGLRGVELMQPSSRYYIRLRDLLPTSLEVLGA